MFLAARVESSHGALCCFQLPCHPLHHIAYTLLHLAGLGYCHHLQALQPFQLWTPYFQLSAWDPQVTKSSQVLDKVIKFDGLPICAGTCCLSNSQLLLFITYCRQWQAYTLHAMCLQPSRPFPSSQLSLFNLGGHRSYPYMSCLAVYNFAFVIAIFNTPGLIIFP